MTLVSSSVLSKVVELLPLWIALLLLGFLAANSAARPRIAWVLDKISSSARTKQKTNALMSLSRHNDNDSSFSFSILCKTSYAYCSVSCFPQTWCAYIMWKCDQGVPNRLKKNVLRAASYYAFHRDNDCGVNGQGLPLIQASSYPTGPKEGMCWAQVFNLLWNQQKSLYFLCSATPPKWRVGWLASDILFLPCFTGYCSIFAFW